MEKHEGYSKLQDLFASGKIKTFNDIFTVIPEEILRHDMGWTKSRLDKIKENPFYLAIGEAYKIQTLAGMPGRDLFSI